MAHHYRKKIAYVNGALIIINVLYFFYLEWKGSTQDAEFMITYGAMFTPLITEQGEYYRLLTSVFMHFGLSHLANNMVIQFVLGDNLERALGPLKYLLLYLVSGIGANIFSMIISINDYELSVSAGASGAIFGVIGGVVCGGEKPWTAGRFKRQAADTVCCLFPVFWFYQYRGG